MVSLSSTAKHVSQLKAATSHSTPKSYNLVNEYFKNNNKIILLFINA